MNADNRVDGFDGFATGDGGGSGTRCGLVEAGMKGVEGLKVLLVWAGEGGVNGISGERSAGPFPQL